jgi:DNA (cytosine-5)-methyltransferase 1
MRGPSAFDLFCGCGGLSLGMKQAGFRVLGAVDIDPLSVQTYKANHPEVEVWLEDIRALRGPAVRKKLQLRKGELDLLAGCPPCQGFSTLRTLNGGRSIEDPRNDLVFDFLRLVQELKPKAVMMENVPGLGADRRMVDFCRSLSELGYGHRYRVLNAADFGVPQRRRRLILLAARSGAVDFAQPSTERPTVRSAIGSLPTAGESGDALHDLPESRSPRVEELIRKIPKDGGSRLQLGRAHQLECHLRCTGFKDVYGRMAWDAPAPTITSGCYNPSKGRFLHPDEDRGITLREAALLQSFPGDYRFPVEGGKLALAGLIGNAFPPEFVRRHAARVAAHLSD